MTSRWATRTRKAYLRWLELASHELFHAWNVKRLRPIELGPFDYEREVFTPSLWVVEGITDYYGDVLVTRAGLLVAAGVPRFALGQDRRAADDAWPRCPFGDAGIHGRVDQAVSARREHAEHGDQLLHERRGGGVPARREDSPGDQWRAQPGRGDARGVSRATPVTRGFTPDEFRALTEHVAGIDLGAFWRSAIEGTEELDYSEALEVFGLRSGRPTASAERQTKAWLGATTRD